MSTDPLDGCVPGVLSKKLLWNLAQAGLLKDVSQELLDHSSFDLTITDEGYLMAGGSIKPFNDYEQMLKELQTARLCEPLQRDDGTFLLHAKQTYVFKVKQRLGRGLRNYNVHGQATARSSVGRVDVLVRLIVDGMDCYETFTPEGADRGGAMYLELTPLTFDVRIKPGAAVSQLRLFYGHPEACEIGGPDLYRSVFVDGENSNGSLSVDLTNTSIANDSGCAFRAIQNNTPVSLWRTDKGENPHPLPRPQSYWELHPSVQLCGKACLTIEKESFYIMRSKEKIALPAGVAVYCRAIDETIGEMRIHYAGFVHPLFGRDRKDKKIGTPLIFEVRGHDVKVILTDNEKLARLTFYRMADDAVSGNENSYSEQTLKLSSFFGNWG